MSTCTHPAKNRELTIDDKLCIAISILQAKILANDTALKPDSMFGITFNMPTPALEMAERLLVEVLHDLPDNLGQKKPLDGVNTFW